MEHVCEANPFAQAVQPFKRVVLSCLNLHWLAKWFLDCSWPLLMMPSPKGFHSKLVSTGIYYRKFTLWFFFHSPCILWNSFWTDIMLIIDICLVSSFFVYCLVLSTCPGLFIYKLCINEFIFCDQKVTAAWWTWSQPPRTSPSICRSSSKPWAVSLLNLITARKGKSA